MTTINCDTGEGFGIWLLGGDENTMPSVPPARTAPFRTEIEG